jgi:cobalt/nickel transport system permease protein
MLQELFAAGNSLLHRMDPRFRVFFASLYSIVIAMSRDFQILTGAIVISSLLVILAQLPAREILKRLLAVNTFILLLWLILPVTFHGAVAFKLGPFPVYSVGITMATQITLKSNAIVMALIALIATMNFSILGYALNWLRMPDKIVHLLLMTYRYIFLIEQEYQRLIRAARIRGFQPGTNLHTYKTYANVVGMLLVRSSLRADRVYKAMLCRGFRRKFYCLHEFDAGRREWVFAIIMSGIIMLLIYFEWM